MSFVEGVGRLCGTPVEEGSCVEGRVAKKHVEGVYNAKLVLLGFIVAG